MASGLPNIGLINWRYRPQLEPKENLSSLQTFVDSVLGAFKRFGDLGVMNATRFTGLVLVTGTPFVLNHGLNRVPQGWYVTRVTSVAGSLIFETITNPPSTTTITFNCSANCTANIVVF